MNAIFHDFGIQPWEPARTILSAMAPPDPGPSNGEVAPMILLGSAFVSGVIALGVVIALLMSRLGRGSIVEELFFVGRRHRAVVLRTLASSLEAGRDVPDTLRVLGETYPRRRDRRRLHRAAHRVERGEAWVDALRDEGLLGRADTALIRAASSAGNLPWALREAATSGERRLNYRLAIVSQLVRSVAIGGLGVLILLFALTYFVPLITLIEAMARAI